MTKESNLVNKSKKQGNSLQGLPPVPPPMQSEIKELHEIPDYLTSVYQKRYFNKMITRFFDDEWVSCLSTFFMGRKLKNQVVSEIIEGDDVLQLGLSSGSFESAIAMKMNSKGHYHIEDISIEHIESAKSRLSAWLNAKLIERDFTISNKEKYDVVVCYFTLHELPDSRKQLAIKRAFSVLKPNGKIIFIDYSKPNKFHPLKWIVKNFNRLFEPFAESLWHKEIQDFAPKTNALIWAKKTLFFGMYQCVIAQKK